jgi:hypothetical protein
MEVVTLVVTTTRQPAEGLAGSPRGQRGDTGKQQHPSAEARLAWRRRVPRSPLVRHLIVLVCYLAAGIAVTWPRVTYLTEGKLPATRDGGTYVWDFWWMAHQVEHFGNPWFTRAIAAPAGAQLGYHALMPLEGVLMLPVTALFGPSASYNLLSVLMPGLLAYALYRVARLWLRSQLGAITAGALFGLSSMFAWHAWYQLNLAAGMLFIPLALEAAVRLRRRPGRRQAVVLGLVIAAGMLTDQESVVLVIVIVALALIPWLAEQPWRALAPRLPDRAALRTLPRRTPGLLKGLPPLLKRMPGAAKRLPGWLAGLAAALARQAGKLPGFGKSVVAGMVPRRRRGAQPETDAAPETRGGEGPAWQRRFALSVGAAAVALAVGSPQIIAMVAQNLSGGAKFPMHLVDSDYVMSGAALPRVFAVSPVAVSHGLTALQSISYQGPEFDGVPTFGLVLSALALLGLIVARRRRTARWLGVLWLGSAALSLGSTLKIGSHVFVPLAQSWNGVRVSLAMPYTWFVQVPGMSGFREAARIIMLGLVPASLLAGAAVEWLREHAAALLIPVLLFGALEVGWSGNSYVGTMPTALPALDGPIAADHSGSIVVDVPFGVRGGVPLSGEGGMFSPESEVLGTADGHPRAVAYLSRAPEPTLATIHRHPFYEDLLRAQGESVPATVLPPASAGYPYPLPAVRADVRAMHIGWVLIWQKSPGVTQYLAAIGFKFDYAADGVAVYRPASDLAGAASQSR